METQLKEIILEAGKILKEGYFSTKKVTHKGAKDLVTQYDVAVENFLTQKFSQAFSDFSIIAEESENHTKEFGNSIIIDPIDGTTNFVNGVPHCAISVGVYREKKPFIGIVYNPILGQYYSANVGNGAFCNGKKIDVSTQTNFQSALLATGFPYSGSENKDDLDFILNNLSTILPKCQDIRRLGSASLDLCMVASGIFEGYFEINLKPWDVSAGIIILQEAGGKVSNHFGETYDMFEDKCIVASNGKIHQQLVTLIQ